MWSEQKDSNLRLSLPRGVISPLNYAQSIRAARRDRTCLVLRVRQVSSLENERRNHSWITCESNAVRTLYQRVQGNQPVVILGEPRGNQTLLRGLANHEPHQRIGSLRAGRGSRTLIVGLEDRGPTVGRYQLIDIQIKSFDEWGSRLDAFASSAHWRLLARSPRSALVDCSIGGAAIARSVARSSLP